jgi:hypothetical protein
LAAFGFSAGWPDCNQARNFSTVSRKLTTEIGFEM